MSACGKDEYLSREMIQTTEAQNTSTRKSRHQIDSAEFKSYTASDHYWFFNTKIPIIKQEDREVIVFTEENRSVISQNFQAFSQNQKKFGQSLHYPSQGSGTLSGANPYTSNKFLFEVVKKNGTNSLLGATPNQIYYKGVSYLTEEGDELLAVDVIVLELEGEEALGYLEDDIEKYGLTILERNPLSPLTYRISCKDSHVGGAVAVANLLYNLGGYRYVQPDFLTKFELLNAPNDPKYPEQWFLKDQTYLEGYDINIESGWAISKGSELINIAVIDDGVDLRHPDINLSEKNYNAFVDKSPSELYGSHGTPCAGIITGKGNNGIGISGVAPNCKVIPISLHFRDNVGFISSATRAFDYARKEADVISNSWRCPPGHPVLQQAIEKALTEGRGGRGCVIVAAAGNDDLGTVLYPARSHPDVIAVGAMSMCGERKSKSSCDGENFWGSNFGDALDVVAPGVKITTTSTNQSYTNTFNGTSSACPQVSGVAALILSVNPNLTQKEVSAIISRSARKLPKYNYNQDKEYGRWNKEVGYGLLDAHSALLLASSDSRITYFNDKIVDILTAISGFQIQSKNVQLRKGGLNFKAQDMITIDPPFSVAQGVPFSLVHS